MQGVFTVARLLALDAYRGAILTGLVFSMGSIDVSLVNAVTAALQKFCHSGLYVNKTNSHLIRSGILKAKTHMVFTADQASLGKATDLEAVVSCRCMI